MFLWRGSLLPLGGEAPVNPACRVYLEEWGSRFWVCCAAQREQAPSPQECFSACGPSSWPWTQRREANSSQNLPNLSAWRCSCGEGIYPRWAAQQPRNLTSEYIWLTACIGFGAASLPIGDKSPHYRITSQIEDSVQKRVLPSIGTALIVALGPVPGTTAGTPCAAVGNCGACMSGIAQLRSGCSPPWARRMKS